MAAGERSDVDRPPPLTGIVGAAWQPVRMPGPYRQHRRQPLPSDSVALATGTGSKMRTRTVADPLCGQLRDTPPRGRGRFASVGESVASHGPPRVNGRRLLSRGATSRRENG